MADSKISELNPITGSQIEDQIDLMVLADVSASETKKITVEQLFRERNLVNGTINGMVIGGSTPAAGTFTSLNASGLAVTTSDDNPVSVTSTDPLVSLLMQDGDSSGPFQIKYETDVVSFNVAGANRVVLSDTHVHTYKNTLLGDFAGDGQKVAIGRFAGGETYLRFAVSGSRMDIATANREIRFSSGTSPFNIVGLGGVGIGETTPDAKLVVSRLGADVAVSGFSGNTALILHPGTSTATEGSGIHIVGNASANTGLTFGTPTSGTKGAVFYSMSLDRMDFYTNGAPRARIEPDGTFRALAAAVVNGDLYASRFVKGSTAGVHTSADDVVVSSGGLTPGMSVLANEVGGVSSIFMGTPSNNAAGRLQWSQSSGQVTLLSTQGLQLNSNGVPQVVLSSGVTTVQGSLRVAASGPTVDSVLDFMDDDKNRRYTQAFYDYDGGSGPGFGLFKIDVANNAGVGSSVYRFENSDVDGTDIPPSANSVVRKFELIAMLQDYGLIP